MAGSNPEFIRGAGVGWQDAIDVPAASLAWCPYWTALELTYEPTADTPDYLDYSLWRETDTAVAVYDGKVHGEGRLDPYWVGWPLISIAGVPVPSGPDWVFDGGSAGAGLLTFAKVNPQVPDTFTQMWNVVLTALVWRIDPATGMLSYTFDGRGKINLAAPSPPTPSYTASVPRLHPYQAVYTGIGAAPASVRSGTLTWEKTISPNYGTYLVAATAGTPEGLQPDSYNVSKAGGGYDLLLNYGAYAGSPLEALVLGTEYAQALSIVDPKTAGTPGLTLEMPRTKGNTGGIDDSEAQPRQHLVGRWLRDTTGALGGGVRATLSPGAGQTYVAS